MRLNFLKLLNNRITAAEYQKLISQPDRKYRNKKTEIHGHVFDSQAEANRYCELKLLEKSGQIEGFGIQPSFVLSNGIRYRPDFIVCASGVIWVEDVKGVETKDFKIKQKLWKERYPWMELKIIK